MFKKNLIIFYSVILVTHLVLATTWQGKLTHLAVIKDPVVDLFIKLPLQNNAPICCVQARADHNCQRCHQVLAHEVVTVLAIKDTYVQIACDNLVYGIDEKTGQPKNSFWVDKKHLIFFKDLSQDLLKSLPGPIGSIKNTLVLVRPWKKYSLGTRFVRSPEHDTKYSYAVRILRPCSKSVKISTIPRELAKVEGEDLTVQQKRKYFVKLAYDIIEYAHNKGGVIPYVWGGSSFVYPYKDNFTQKENKWHRDELYTPCCGYDCSELVLRLAQISGIPYFWKTTNMLATQNQALQAHDQLEEGDLVWFPGHVMIVGDLKRNELIEARGYGGGFGKVQVISLDKYFANVKNYDELLSAYREKKPLIILKKDGTVQLIVEQFKLLKLIA